MLAALGFITVIVMLVLIMTKKASPLVALIAVPVITGIQASFFIAVVPEGAPDAPAGRVFRQAFRSGSRAIGFLRGALRPEER